MTPANGATIIVIVAFGRSALSNLQGETYILVHTNSVRFTLESVFEKGVHAGQTLARVLSVIYAINNPRISFRAAVANGPRSLISEVNS